MNSKKILTAALVILGLGFVSYRLVTRGSRSVAETERRVVLYNWSEFMDPVVLEEFTQETGIAVVEEIFDSNETLRAKLLAGADGYDVVVPSGVMITTLVRDQLLEKLDRSKLPNIANIDPLFRGLYFDPHDEYSVPYLWTSTGIGYRRDLVATPPDSWAALFDPAKIGQYKSKISTLDDPREALGAALQYLGFSVNSVSQTEIDKAVAVLKKQREYLARYDSETYGDQLAAGDLVLAQGWLGTITKASFNKPEVSYIVPKEGGIVGVDCFAIPNSSKHKKEAHLLIDFLMRPEINGRLVNKTFYPTANAAGEQFVNPTILANKSIYPDREALSKMEWLKDVGESNELYEKAWEVVRFAQ